MEDTKQIVSFTLGIAGPAFSLYDSNGDLVPKKQVYDNKKSLILWWKIWERWNRSCPSSSLLHALLNGDAIDPDYDLPKENLDDDTRKMVEIVDVIESDEIVGPAALI